MDIHSRPTTSERKLFAALASELRDHDTEYLEAAGWFRDEFSLKAIHRRAAAPRDEFERKALADYAREGFTPSKTRIGSAPAIRIVRAAEYLLGIDDTSLLAAPRERHHRRLILVAALATDPDFRTDAPQSASTMQMERDYWLTEAEVTGEKRGGPILLNRWWARGALLFDGHDKYAQLKPRVRAALRAVARERARNRPKDDVTNRPADRSDPTHDTARLADAVAELNRKIDTRAPPANPVEKQRRPKPGRPPVGVGLKDAQIRDAWATKSHKTYADLARVLDLDEDYVRKVIDRNRPRRPRSR